MIANIKNFCGVWKLTQVAGTVGFWAPGYLLEIGTGRGGATAPYLSPEGDVCAGFAVLELTPGGFVEVLSSADGQNQLLEFVLVDGVLRWIGSYTDQPLSLYISLCERQTLRGKRYLYLYGSTVFGDPEQVGVWGAEANPPAP
jgi:hypothetical protein